MYKYVHLIRFALFSLFVRRLLLNVLYFFSLFPPKVIKIMTILHIDIWYVSDRRKSLKIEIKQNTSKHIWFICLLVFFSLKFLLRKDICLSDAFFVGQNICLISLFFSSSDNLISNNPTNWSLPKWNVKYLKI